MSGRVKTRQEGEAVALKSVRKHQLVLAFELKRLNMEHLVAERYYMFERALVQSRLNRLVTRQKELGIYRPGSPLTKSINLPNRARNKKTKQPFFVTAGTIPPVNIAKHRFPPRTIEHYKRLINKELSILQERIKQFDHFKKRESFNFAQSRGLHQTSPNTEKTMTQCQGDLTNVQKLENSSHSVQNEESDCGRTEEQQNLRTKIKNQVLLDVQGQDASDNLETQQALKLPAINNSGKISLNKINTKKVKRNLKNSKTSKAKTLGPKFQKPRAINSSAENDSRVENMANGITRKKTSKGHPIQSLQELDNKMSKLDIQADQILNPEQSKRPRTMLDNYKEMLHVNNISATPTTSLRPQSAH